MKSVMTQSEAAIVDAMRFAADTELIPGSVCRAVAAIIDKLARAVDGNQQDVGNPDMRNVRCYVECRDCCRRSVYRGLAHGELGGLIKCGSCGSNRLQCLHCKRW